MMNAQSRLQCERMRSVHLVIAGLANTTYCVSVCACRPVKLQLLQATPVTDNCCTICVDNVADTTLEPCTHWSVSHHSLTYLLTVLCLLYVDLS